MNRAEASFEPAYLALHRSGELRRRGEELMSMLASCQLCPRSCGVSRLEGEKGFCQADARLKIASYHPHFGEEAALVGRRGSGTIFFANCGLRCVFCINWNISIGGEGKCHTIEDLAGMMISLQEMGCHNINLVTPTHYLPHIILALDMATEEGLNIPLVYNTCGAERLEILKMLDGVIDIYLPDFKYFSSEMAAKYSSGASWYPEVTKQALIEMNRQVGVARAGSDGIMRRGLMIRHLVMPNNVSHTKEVLEWIAENLPKDTYVNLMSQYQPFYKAFEYPDIARRLSREEYSQAKRWAKEAGLTNVEFQGDRW
ncbi:MAG: radical SAM protein [Candidatus Omnitrophota bacterium]|nr:MAG: radical SAM protein [Candidatus Omnitrophota bacterium]